jgi:hypothetical protein
LKSTTFVVELVLKYAREGARFRMIPRPSPLAAFENNHASEHEVEKAHARTERPAAIRPLDVTGKVPVTTERMDAIRNIKTMAGSPDAELSIRSASRRLAHGFCIWRSHSFVNP